MPASGSVIWPSTSLPVGHCGVRRQPSSESLFELVFEEGYGETVMLGADKDLLWEVDGVLADYLTNHPWGPDA